MSRDAIGELEWATVGNPPFQPYCGAAPVPEALHWNLDPALIGLLAIILGSYSLCFRLRKIEIDQRQFFLGCTGIAVLAAALITPLCNLTVALFSARAVQHVLMLLVSAPLLVLGTPRRPVGKFES